MDLAWTRERRGGKIHWWIWDIVFTLVQASKFKLLYLGDPLFLWPSGLLTLTFRDMTFLSLSMLEVVLCCDGSFLPGCPWYSWARPPGLPPVLQQVSPESPDHRLPISVSCSDGERQLFAFQVGS